MSEPPKPDTRPVLTTQEASLIAAQAGVAAKVSAEAAGSDPNMMASLFNGPLVLTEDLIFEPFSLATVMAITAMTQRTQAFAEGAAPAGGNVSSLTSIAGAAFCAWKPKEAVKLLQQPTLEAFNDAAMDLAAQLTAARLKQFNAWMEHQEQLISDEAEDAPAEPANFPQGQTTQ